MSLTGVCGCPNACNPVGYIHVELFGSVVYVPCVTLSTLLSSSSLMSSRRGTVCVDFPNTKLTSLSKKKFIKVYYEYAYFILKVRKYT